MRGFYNEIESFLRKADMVIRPLAIHAPCNSYSLFRPFFASYSHVSCDEIYIIFGRIYIPSDIYDQNDEGSDDRYILYHTFPESWRTAAAPEGPFQDMTPTAHQAMASLGEYT